MQTLRDRIEEIIKEAFGNGRTGVELDELATNRIAGFVTSTVFKGKDDPERQETLWRVLQDAVASGKITEEELTRVSFIITLTPEEDEAYSEVEGE